MRHGNNLISQHKYFYKLIIANNDYVNYIFFTNGIKWISVYEKMECSLGISQNGEWVLKNKSKFYLLNQQKQFLFCANLIESSYFEIKNYIEERFSNILQNEGINETELFPYFEIVEFVFKYFVDDYWFELAWMWYMQFDIIEKRKLYDLLKYISCNKKISQKNRQIVKKEIKEISRIKESLENMEYNGE